MQSKLMDYSEVYKLILAMHANNQLGPPKKEYSSAIKTVISVSGAAAVGKTTFCKGLQAFLTNKGYNATHVQLDGYVKTREERKKIQISDAPGKKLSGYNPKASNMNQLIKDMQDIVYNGKTIQIPIYDHSTGKTDMSMTARPSEIIILDGIMSLQDEIRTKFTTFSVFLYSDEATLKELRLQADILDRGYSRSDALAQSQDELDAYNTWVHPKIKFADLKLLVNRDRTIRVVE